MAVTVRDIQEKLRLSVVYGDDSLLSKEITTADISRPGLEMTGYFDYYTPERIQLVGMKEWSYLVKMSSHNRHQVLRKMFQPETPVIIVARNLEIPEEMLRAAEEKQLAILKSNVATSRLSGELSSYLDSRLAERTSVHGVLMDIYGMGVLIQGDSGIGKSEAALELIKRGHRLVTDDVVEIRKVSDATLIGSSPDITRHFIELRGIGIIDVKTLFGVESVKNTQSIDLVIKLEEWDREKEYDRLGLEEEYTEFLGNQVVCHSLPIRPGRNLAVIVEAAAVNHRQKKMGYNAAKELYNRVQASLTRKRNPEEE